MTESDRKPLWEYNDEELESNFYFLKDPFHKSFLLKLIISVALCGRLFTKDRNILCEIY